MEFHHPGTIANLAPKEENENNGRGNYSLSLVSNPNEALSSQRLAVDWGSGRQAEQAASQLFADDTKR
jgi:hypothetical protein